MSGSSDYCTVKKSGSSFEGKWYIVVILLAAMHIISFTWMIQMQMKLFNLQEKIRKYEEFERGFVDDYEEENVAASPNDGELHRSARTLKKSCEKFRNRVKRCKVLDQKPPQFAKYTDTVMGPSKKRNLIQLRGKAGDGGRTEHKAQDVVKDWSQDFSNGLGYDPASGSIKVTVAGYYYIYAQMLPYLFTDAETEWEFTIQRKTTDGKVADLAISKLSIPGCKSCSKTTMTVCRTKYLEKGDGLAIKITSGTQWYSSDAVQSFGAYLL